MNYTTLIADKSTAGSIKSWVNHNLLDVVQIVEEAEALIAQTLRVREMRASTPLSLALGDSSTALPTGFLDPISLKDITNEILLSPRTEHWIEDARGYDSGVLLSGTPANYAIFDEAFQFEYKYDAAATLRLVYFKKWTALSSAGTNFLTDRYPHLLRTAVMAKAWEFRERADLEAKELQKLAAIIQKTNAETDLTYRGLVADNRVA